MAGARLARHVPVTRQKRLPIRGQKNSQYSQWSICRPRQFDTLKRISPPAGCRKKDIRVEDGCDGHGYFSCSRSFTNVSRSSSDRRSQSRARSAQARRNCSSPNRSRSSRRVWASWASANKAVRLRAAGNCRTSEITCSSLNSKTLICTLYSHPRSFKTAGAAKNQIPVRPCGGVCTAPDTVQVDSVRVSLSARFSSATVPGMMTNTFTEKTTLEVLAAVIGFKGARATITRVASKPAARDEHRHVVERRLGPEMAERGQFRMLVTSAAGGGGRRNRGQPCRAGAGSRPRSWSIRPAAAWRAPIPQDLPCAATANRLGPTCDGTTPSCRRKRANSTKGSDKGFRQRLRQSLSLAGLWEGSDALTLSRSTLLTLPVTGGI